MLKWGGNMLSLQRNGRQDDGDYGAIDDVTFSYSGNQLVKADDNAVDPTYAGAFNFVDGSDADVEYEYDQNGNMTKDLNKNISSIQYNSLNLPQTISFGNGNVIQNTYSASGVKLKADYYVSQMNQTQANLLASRSYCGSCIYEDGQLQQILVDGGYITFSGTTPTYHYYLKDHLGNNRVVASGDGTIEQVNHYYPYGGLMGESTGGDTQRYKYNGKELDRMHGLDWYDYGARYMDGARGQFTTIDPLAEKDYPTSPYAYCANDPVNKIDPDGREVRDGLGSYNKENKDLKQLTKDLAKHNDSKSIMIVAHGVMKEGDNFSSSINIQTYNAKTEKWNDNYISTGKELGDLLSKTSKVWNQYKAGKIDAEDLHIVFYSCGSSEVVKKMSSDSEFKDITFIAPNKDIGVTAQSGVIVSDLKTKSEGKKVIDNSPGKGIGLWTTIKNGKYSASHYSGGRNLKPGTAKFKY